MAAHAKACNVGAEASDLRDTGYRIPVNKIQTSAGRINKRALAKNPFIWHSFNPPKRLVNFEYLKTNKYKKSIIYNS
jgi:hypothetical protein